MVPMNTMQNQVLNRVRHASPGQVFTSKDFLDLGGRAATDQALSRLARQGVLQRLGRGVYHRPRRNDRLGIDVPPDADGVANAFARKTGSRVVPSGALAANRLGLSTQVPAKPVYLTDGPSRDVQVGQTVIQIKHVAARQLAASPMSVMVLQALQHLGRDRIDNRVVQVLRRNLTPDQRTALLQDARYATCWMADVARRVASAEPDSVHG